MNISAIATCVYIHHSYAYDPLVYTSDYMMGLMPHLRLNECVEYLEMIIIFVNISEEKHIPSFLRVYFEYVIIYTYPYSFHLACCLK